MGGGQESPWFTPIIKKEASVALWMPGTPGRVSLEQRGPGRSPESTSPPLLPVYFNIPGHVHSSQSVSEEPGATPETVWSTDLTVQVRTLRPGQTFATCLVASAFP